MGASGKGKELRGDANTSTRTSEMREPKGFGKNVVTSVDWLFFFFLLSPPLSSFSSSFLNFSLASAMKSCRMKCCQPALTVTYLQALHNSSQPHARFVQRQPCAPSSCQWHRKSSHQHRVPAGLPAQPRRQRCLLGRSCEVKLVPIVCPLLCCNS